MLNAARDDPFRVGTRVLTEVTGCLAIRSDSRRSRKLRKRQPSIYLTIEASCTCLNIKWRPFISNEGFASLASRSHRVRFGSQPARRRRRRKKRVSPATVINHGYSLRHREHVGRRDAVSQRASLQYENRCLPVREHACAGACPDRRRVARHPSRTSAVTDEGRGEGEGGIASDLRGERKSASE